MNKTLLALAAATALTYAAAAPAYQTGDWIVRGGSHYVDPKSNNSDIVDVDGAFGLTGSIEYFVAPQFAVDVLLAVPFKHDIKLADGGDKVASTRDLPPTLSLVWYPNVSTTVHPYIGAGLNYTTFFDEKTKGALAGTKLSLDDSFGFAAVGGIAFDLSDHWQIGADVRWFDIDTKAKVDGSSIGTVEIDPFGYGLNVGYRF
ncbi:OmpW/AlkL family protein [Solimonas marina]|uniref:Outer membrane beta-barrel protein n=1 Tax=Solimonas marina TaxID=2714601 RepID=A0A970B9M0_9GAMM|nr:OmpW family outer membrane protein [Solimonas marina]NKF23484.1 outer membrane beta-barrel protein [Solimonas marina]